MLSWGDARHVGGTRHAADARSDPRWPRAQDDRRPRHRDAPFVRRRVRRLARGHACRAPTCRRRLAVRLRVADLESGVPLHRPPDRNGLRLIIAGSACGPISGAAVRTGPGLVLGLERGGSCRGVAFYIAPDAVEEELAIVWRREMLSGAYVPRWVDVHTALGTIRAITSDQPRARALRPVSAGRPGRRGDRRGGGLPRALRRLPDQHGRPPGPARHPRPPARTPAHQVLERSSSPDRIGIIRSGLHQVFRPTPNGYDRMVQATGLGRGHPSR